jgi:hypothetical protein
MNLSSRNEKTRQTRRKSENGKKAKDEKSKAKNIYIQEEIITKRKTKTSCGN